MDSIEKANDSAPTQIFDSLDQQYVIKVELEHTPWGKRCWLSLYKPVHRDEDSGLPWFMNSDEELGDTDILDEAIPCAKGIVEDKGAYEWVTCPYDEMPCGDNIGDLVSFSMVLVESYTKACQLLGAKDASVLPLDQWNRCIDQFRGWAKP